MTSFRLAKLMISFGFVLFMASGSILGQSKMYWTDSRQIKRANRDGSNIENVIISHDLRQVDHVALDIGGKKIYWTDSAARIIRRSNFDGSNVEELVLRGSTQSPGSIALDISLGKMYWIDDKNIRRSNLDGSEIEDLVTLSSDNPISLALDLANKKVYWTSAGGEYKIQRANFDGSNIEKIADNQGYAPALALDTASGKMYWTDASNGKIQRSNLDGSNKEELVFGLDNDPFGIALNLVTGKIYWTESNGSFQNPLGKIRRSNLDGSAIEDIVAVGLVDPRGIALDQDSGKMYWTEPSSSPSIKRADLDGSAIEVIINGYLDRPANIAFDMIQGKMYWSDTFLRFKSAINRANLDGSDFEHVIEVGGVGNTDEFDIALDIRAGKIYWVDNREQSIRRANLDGSEIENILGITPFATPAISLDPARGKIYWIDENSGKIQRANLVGSNIEDVITTGLGTFSDLYLDLAHGKIYWSDPRSSHNLHRANLDGSNIEVVIVNFFGKLFTIDADANKIYWSDFEIIDKIQRSNIDGTDVEGLITDGLDFVRGIALDTPAGANFSGYPLSGFTPLTVSFAEVSDVPVTSYSWDFGDGNTSTDRNPTHVFESTGLYSVSLTVTGSAGTFIRTRNDYISSNGPQADFSATPTSGVSPLTVTFSNQSAGPIATTSWSFGDGGSSNESNPTHVYQEAGLYTLSLQVEGPGGVDTETKVDYINVVAPTAPIADFVASPTLGISPLTVSFTDQSTGTISTRSWNLGDGQTSSDTSPIHTYINAGIYTVSLELTGPTGSDTKTIENYIIVAEPLGQNFISKWILESGTYNESAINNLTGEIDITDGSNYTARFSDGNNRGSVIAIYTINNGKVFNTNIPNNVLLIGIASLPGWFTNMNTTKAAFDQYGATAIGYGNPNVYISGNNLTLISSDGKTKLKYAKEGFTPVESSDDAMPTHFVLEQNYPNPFNPSTKIRYRIPNRTFVRITIHDLRGRLVEIIVNKQQNAGVYTVEWSAPDFSSGIYFYQIKAGEFSQTKKATLLR